MNLMEIDMTEGTVAAYASSHMDGRERWTSLEVRHFPAYRRCWVAEVRGVSSLPGERDKVRRLASGNLERALRLFDDSDLGRIVSETAREWAEENGVPFNMSAGTARVRRYQERI